MEKEKMPMTLCGYEIPSNDIKIRKRYLASDGWEWYITVADYGWVITNSPGYESYTKDGYKNNLGYEKNFEEAYQWLLKTCKRNDWTLKELRTISKKVVLEKLLTAKKDGFFDGYSMWSTDEFVIDYDTVRKEFCLRSITNAYTLGKTRFYESGYKKTWWLKKDKSE